MNTLDVNPGDHPVLLAEAAGLSPRVATTQREEIAETLFEGLGVPALCQFSSPLLAMLSTGRTTGE
eukprot:1177077-Prorocentrum_minimum.AAC.6